MPPARTQAEHERQEQRNKLANSYQSLLTEFSSHDLQSVGNYTLGRLIGKGSFGKVYLATHKLTNGSKVVLKSAKKDDANLAREIHHHRQFLHPHIARLYEVIVTESLVWLVLEYCPGDELYNHLLEHGRMEPAKVQKIFTQLVGAVSYVHGKQCVHRDLKLENILLDKHGNVKLVDFGFTREYQGSTSYLQTWCGTVCYSAPEMLKGEKYAGEKVDVWSLGIILYALLCGELPWDEDDDGATKARILKEELEYPDHIPEGAVQLMKKLLSKRPLIRPPLSDVLKDPWLAEFAPQQQEILKVQQPAPFSTQLEKDTLQRMRSAGVDIDMVIEQVLSQRCDGLAGWWALLIEKEQRKEKRRERKRRDREAEAKSIRRLSAASGRLLSLGGIHEDEEGNVLDSPSARGRRMTRANGNAAHATDLPKVAESKTPTPEPAEGVEPPPKELPRQESRSRSRPPPPPKDYHITPPRRPRNVSRGSGSMLRNVTTNPDLLSPTYVPPPQRKRRTIMQQPLREQIAWVKHWFKDGGYKIGKSPNEGARKDGNHTPQLGANGQAGVSHGELRDLKRTATGNMILQQHRKASIGQRPALETRATLPARPRVNTNSTVTSSGSIQRKRQSLSPHTMTPHSSIRRPSAGLRGRKSTSSSVSSIRTAYQGTHQHSHSKASSTSSASIASPSGLSSASGSRLGRSPHASVKVLPSTPTGGAFPSGIRVSRRPPPSGLGSLPSFNEARGTFTSVPGSPGLPVFARRKRSVFKGPGLSGSPSGFARTSSSRPTSVGPRKSGEMIPGITEEDEDEDMEVEEVDQFGPELVLSTHINDAAREESEAVYTEPVSPISPLPRTQHDEVVGNGSGVVPLTAEALRVKEEEDERVERQASGTGV
ncbi:uncharacterized protein LTR77_002312 [Saxophila tyrrhenica]|uniref:Protein kinase domain-containing protein n=1 Tax=Saxophila tyrrhenica TaxID=1690608 RepID=A0AAV9PJZ1_9PEZI|nr:hypothetical protein LTR77_002312 [Saxophila tyrrhenica]